MSKDKSLIFRRFGERDYVEVWREMQEFTLARTPDTPEEIWFLEHPPVFTQGRAGCAEHILNPGAIPVIQVDRGGQVTYHGPGQLIIYVLYDLRRSKIGVKKFVSLLEQAVIEMLVEFNISAERKGGAPGIYVAETGAKICSLGLRIRRGASYHGLALNVINDLEPFSRINPCGFKNLKIVRMKDFVDVTMEQVMEILEQKLLLHLA